MNCPSRTDGGGGHPEWNQNPSALSNDLTTRQDLNGIANLRRLSRDHSTTEHSSLEEEVKVPPEPRDKEGLPGLLEPAKDAFFEQETNKTMHEAQDNKELPRTLVPTKPPSRRSLTRTTSDALYQQTKSSGASTAMSKPFARGVASLARSLTRGAISLASFVGPGFLVAVAYIDPGNYSTDVSAGAATKYKHLFIVLISNIIAVVLQSLSIRLGTVTGKNLSEHCRAHLPKWLNIFIYVLAEVAIIATDLAEVIGSAIALNLLFPKIPLVAGCAITIVDVLLILLFYSPGGSLSRLRLFEYFVALLVIAVVVCFCKQLSLLSDTSAGEVMLGYVPSAKIVEGQGIYLSCGILGATVMPHSIFLGSGLVQPRLRHYDEVNAKETSRIPAEMDKSEYKPSLGAIKHCLKYSTIELVISLTGFALFVNSAILIVAGSSLSSNATAQDADLFGIYGLLSSSIASAAGTIFAVALFFSGTAAGIVCTIAGQMVSEGHINWRVAPWLRRLLTRSISIIPSIIIAGTIGRNGLSIALNASQVILSVVLPFVTAPLIYFTCRTKYMTVHDGDRGGRSEGEAPPTSMRSHLAVTIVAIIMWLVITVMDIALLVFVGLGREG